MDMQYYYDTAEVAPFAGAWIEMPWSCRPCAARPVAPFAGAWIEIKVAPSSGILVSLSLPSRERGLKCVGYIDLSDELRSLSSRERGLK